MKINGFKYVHGGERWSSNLSKNAFYMMGKDNAILEIDLITKFQKDQ